MTSNSQYVRFTLALVERLRAEIMEPGLTAQIGASAERAQGIAFALRQVLGVMQGQAISFDIPPEHLGLAGYDPMIDPILKQDSSGESTEPSSLFNNAIGENTREDALEASTLQGYIRDVAYLLRGQAAEASALNRRAPSEFDAGLELGLRQTLLWMQNGADNLLIDKDTVCLSGFDPLTGATDPPTPRPLVDSDV